jgi:hypothetical protein
MFSSSGFVTKTSLAFLVLPWKQHVSPKIRVGTEWRVQIALTVSVAEDACALEVLKHQDHTTCKNRGLGMGQSHVQVTIPNTEKYSLFEQLLNGIHERITSWVDAVAINCHAPIHSSITPFLLGPDIPQGTVLWNAHTTHRSCRLKQDCNRKWVETLL